MDPLSLNELAELLLVASYEEMEALGHSNFFISVTEIASNLGVEDHSQIIDACHLLEEKGCILLAFDHATALSASITPEGEAYVASGGETGIIGEYQRYRRAKAGIPPTPAGLEFEGPDFSPSVPGSSAPYQDTPPVSKETASPAVGNREDVKHIVASLEMLLTHNTSLSATEKSDLFIDLKSLEMQVSRNTPRRSIVDAIASDLKKLPGLAPLVDLLIARI